MNWRKITALILLTAVTACHRKGKSASTPLATPAAPVAVAPPPLNVAVADPAPVPDRVPYEALALEPVASPVVAPIALVEADYAFDIGDYAQAARSYASYLQANPEAHGLDRVLFRLGVAQSMTAPTSKDPSGNDTFNRLIRDYSDSPYAAPARVIVGLRAEIARSQSDVKNREDRIKQLSDELERLKKIDLDRRRTP